MDHSFVVMVDASCVICVFYFFVSHVFGFVGENIASIFDVEVETSAESGFQICIIGFPCYDLSIGAGEIGIDQYVAGTGDEEAPDVGEGDCGGDH
jgi:hypothetical protein